MSVAATILEQLGGRKFVVMTGAKHLIDHGNALSFKLPGSGGFTKSGINLVKITLDPSDTYTVTFSRFRGLKVTEISSDSGIYFDGLIPLFERTTGLATRLF